MTTPNDTPEPSLASAGSQPVAIMSWEQADQIIQDQRAEIERLRSRLRFADAVIRSGDVAALTDEERHAIAVVRNCAMTRAERFLTQSDAEREATLVLWRLRERLG
jgi:vacuolar-type H+-ATPase subunit E/Vma4